MKNYNHYKKKSQDFEQLLDTASDKGKKAIKIQIFALLSKKIKFFPGFVIFKNESFSLKAIFSISNYLDLKKFSEVVLQKIY